MLRAIILFALINIAAAGWCDSKSTGYHCRSQCGEWIDTEATGSRNEKIGSLGQTGYTSSQYCECELELEWKTTPAVTNRRRRRSSTRLEMEWDCDSEGKEIPCEHGCNTRTGQCVRLSPSQTCGTNWPTTTATRQYQLCPATTGSYRTFADLMGASYRVNGQLSQVASDVAWFEAKLKSDFYSPRQNNPNTRITLSCADTAWTVGRCSGDKTSESSSDLTRAACQSWCNGVGAACCRTESTGGTDVDECKAHNNANGNTIGPSDEAGDYSCNTGAVTVTLPATLAALATPTDIAIYQEFTCLRNLPKCVNNALVTTDCVARCLSISDKLAAYSEACRALPADGTFDCFDLGTLPADRGGCAEPWCHIRPAGQGVRGQGWERDCAHLCQEAAPAASRSSTSNQYSCRSIRLSGTSSVSVSRTLLAVGWVGWVAMLLDWL